MKVLQMIAASAVMCAVACVASAQNVVAGEPECHCGEPDAVLMETVAAQGCSPMGMNALNVSTQQRELKKRAAVTNNDYFEPAKVSFAWGADIGASIDLTGNDMSAFDFNVLLGIKRGWINFLGAGVGADISITNSSRAYPVFLAFRTNFRDRPSLLFWELRGGMAYNQLEHNHEQWGVYGSTGVGVNLARSSKFSSSLSLNYVFRQRKKVVGSEMTHDFTDLHMISVRLGVIF